MVPRSEEFNPPKVKDAPVTVFDEHGLGQEANNLAAINSLKGYRSLRWGRNVELMITDERSYRSEDPGTKFADADFFNKDYSEFVPEEVLEITRWRPGLQRRQTARHHPFRGQASSEPP